MPKETIRYAVKKRFPELGLQVGMLADYEKLGLERYFAVLKFPSDVYDYASEVLHRLASVAFLTYRSGLLLDSRHIAIFAVPVALAEQFQSFLNKMIDEGILESVSVERLEWTRHPELKTRYYDFRSRRWAIDWNKIKGQAEPPPAPIMIYEPTPRPEIDAVDTRLIKELEIDPCRNIADVARELGVNDRTLRWHYKNHVSPIISSYYVRWLPIGLSELKALGVVFEFHELPAYRLNQIRSLFNNFAFTWYEVGRRDGYYQAQCAIPTEQFTESLRSMRDGLKEVVTDWNTFIVDLSSALSYTIPYENFSDTDGWHFEQEKALNSIRSLKAATKNMRTRP